MITQQEATPTSFDYLPRLSVERLWDSDWWDGPMSGIAEAAGERVYFNIADQWDDHEDRLHRRFWLVRLSTEEFEWERRCHERFVELVDPHSGPECPRNRLFYQEYPPNERPTYMGNEVIGWFEL